MVKLRMVLIFTCVNLAAIVYSSYLDSNQTEEEVQVISKRGRRFGSSRISTNGRIINGVRADIKDHPWIAYILVCEKGDCEQCGGSIISKQAVLTARHCVKSMSCRGSIAYGHDNKHRGLKFRFKCDSVNIIRHEIVDLAIIKLSSQQRFHSEATKLAIPVNETEIPKVGQKAYAVGWGRACDTPGSCPTQDWHPEMLQVVEINVTGVDETNCKYAGKGLFCAGGLDDKGLKKDSCKGDSGGPLECKDQLGQIYQCGVVSTGPRNPDCGLTPGAYVNLAMPDIINWLVKVGSASNTSRIKTNVEQNARNEISKKQTAHEITCKIEILAFFVCFSLQSKMTVK